MRFSHSHDGAGVLALPPVLMMLLAAILGAVMPSVGMAQDVRVQEWTRRDVAQAASCFRGDAGEFSSLLLHHLGIGSMTWDSWGRIGPYSVQLHVDDDVNFLPRWREVVGSGRLALIRAPGRTRIGLTPNEGDIAYQLDEGVVYLLDKMGNNPPVRLGSNTLDVCASGLLLIVGKKRTLLVAVDGWSLKSPSGASVMMAPGAIVVLWEAAVSAADSAMRITSSGLPQVWTALAGTTRDKEVVLDLSRAASRFLGRGAIAEDAARLPEAILKVSGIELRGPGEVHFMGAAVPVERDRAGGVVTVAKEEHVIAYVGTPGRQVYVDVATGDCLLVVVPPVEAPR